MMILTLDKWLDLFDLNKMSLKMFITTGNFGQNVKSTFIDKNWVVQLIHGRSIIGWVDHPLREWSTISLIS